MLVEAVPEKFKMSGVFFSFTVYFGLRLRILIGRTLIMNGHFFGPKNCPGVVGKKIPKKMECPRTLILNDPLCVHELPCIRVNFTF